MLRAALHAFALSAALIAVVTFAPNQADAQATDPTAPLPRPKAPAAATAAAEPSSPPRVSWGFIEAGYGYFNDDGHDSQGPRFGFAMRAFNYFHLVGDFAWYGEDARPDLLGGIGAHYSVMPKTDVFLDLGCAHSEVEEESGDTGVAVRGGVRTLLLDNLEGGARVTWADLDLYDVAGGVGLIYYIDDTYALATDFDYSNEDQFQVFAGLHFDFDRHK